MNVFNNVVTVVVLALLVLLLAPQQTFAKDYKPGTLLWKFKTGDEIWSSPAIGSDGAIYVGSYDHYIYAVNPNGTLKWKYKTGNQITSSPAIGSDGTIYVNGGDGYLYAINPNGILKWKYEIELWNDSSPAIGEDGTIYVGSGYYLYAITPNGTLKWKYKTGKWVTSSPAIGSDGVIYVGSWDGYLYAFNPNGTLKWKYKTTAQVESSPAIGENGTVYVGSLDHYLYAINPDGTLKWKYETGGRIFSSPVVGRDNTIYVVSGDYLYALKPNGILKWKQKSSGESGFSSAVGKDGTVYNKVTMLEYMKSYDLLVALNPDGTLKWTYKTEGWIVSSPTIGSNGIVYIGNTDGCLYAIYDNTDGPANSPWPMFRHDPQHTGRFAYRAVSVIAPSNMSKARSQAIPVIDKLIAPSNVSEATSFDVRVKISNWRTVDKVEFVFGNETMRGISEGGGVYRASFTLPSITIDQERSLVVKIYDSNGKVVDLKEKTILLSDVFALRFEASKLSYHFADQGLNYSITAWLAGAQMTYGLFELGVFTSLSGSLSEGDTGGSVITESLSPGQIWLTYIGLTYSWGRLYFFARSYMGFPDLTDELNPGSVGVGLKLGNFFVEASKVAHYVVSGDGVQLNFGLLF